MVGHASYRKWDTEICVRKETFLWRRSELSWNSTQLVIQDFILIRVVDFVFSILTVDSKWLMNHRIQTIEV
jgi:hypothetical protein